MPGTPSTGAAKPCSGDSGQRLEHFLVLDARLDGFDDILDGKKTELLPAQAWLGARGVCTVLVSPKLPQACARC